MKKLFLAILISYSTTYSQSENQTDAEIKDKYEAINAYLFTFVKDASKTIVVVKEKMSPNMVLELFSGGNDVKFSYLKIKDIENPELGIQTPLFNWKDYESMRIKYRDSVNTVKYGLLKNKRWMPEDFTMKNIFFVAFEDVMLKEEKGIRYFKNDTQLILLSDPIYYKDKKLLVLGITYKKSTDVGGFSSLVVVMRKIKNKWVVIDKADQYWYN
ncbi:hypothetical protein SAMN05443667_102196 [Flavobacterium gillisiae]|uniref:Uncharacterized protein n=1 Tax=Flavobacterium gillisiae TaxID=150146 RepID=A0A1H3Z0Z8_9FLAO|nr:hypothetical protein [Flavobacterium gillisiae]SEA17014.1 hypothetical protein SAMN05443667_102196 [Flavobacterium gillisiae]